jgi:hypothetical protein
MNKYVWTIVAPYEAIPFRIIKPFDGSLHLLLLLMETWMFLKAS